MKLSDLSVEGFGVWSGLDLARLSPELTVVYGPNEAGKTTLMQFIRAMFFGFSPERRARYLPPVHPGNAGGTIRLMVGDSDCAITRHPDHGGEADRLVVARGARQAVDSHQTLAGILGEVDEPTFTNVFVCGLRELQELATLGDTQAAEELYNLALGVDRVSLADVLRELNASRERLLAADDRPSLVVQLLGQRERLEGEIEELSGSAVRYLTLSAERRRLDAEIGQLEAESARWDEQAKELALARALGDRWLRRATLDDQLKALVGVGTLGPDALERFEQHGAKLDLHQRRMRRLKRRRSQLRRQIDELKINEPLVRQALRLEALGEQQHWLASLEKKLQLAQADIERLEAQTAEGKKQLGLGALAADAPLSKWALDELRQAASELREARREARQMHEKITTGDQSTESVDRRIEQALGAAKDKGLTQALADAGQLVSDLRRRVHLDERLNQLAARETELDAQAQEHLEQQMLPTWAVVGLGGLFVLGCALVLLFLAGLVLPASLGDSLSWPVGLVGVLAAAAAAGGKFLMERGAESRLDRCHQQIGLLGQQIEEARAERDELDARLPRGGGPLVARLQAAEKSLSELEALLPLEAEQGEVKRDADHTRRQAEALENRAREARRHWRQLLAEHGLPADLSPGQLRAMARGRRQLAGAGSELADKRSELGRCSAEYEGLASRITVLVGQTGIVPRSERPLDQLQQCLAELGDQQLRAGQRDELAAQIARLRRRYLKSARLRKRIRHERLLMLRAAGTHDEPEFRRRAALAADAARWTAERARLDQEIAAALAVSSGKSRVAAWLAAGENLEPLEAEVAEGRRLAQARLGSVNQRRGELGHQLKLMSQDRQLAEKRLELEVVNKRLADAFDRWRVLAVCGLVLEAVRAFYEREHQPQALREASVYLRRLTGGRYTRVWTPLGERALRVDDAQGQRLSVEVLSSGTREQLFLALRLALASAYARRGVELPLVFDDVLVNFDVERARSAAAVLRDFARDGHQLLIFTCHEHIARLFRGLKADVRHLPDHLRSNAAVDELPDAEVEALPDFEPPPPPPPPRARPALPAPLAEPVVEVPPEPVEVEPPPPEKPKPRARPKPPPARPRRRLVQATQRVWDAEEFEGELSDRVRRDIWIDEPADNDDANTVDERDSLDDTQAA